MYFTSFWSYEKVTWVMEHLWDSNFVGNGSAVGNFLMFRLAVAVEINDFECHLLSNDTPKTKQHFSILWQSGCSHYVILSVNYNDDT